LNKKIDYEYFEEKLRKEREEVIKEIKILEPKVEGNPIEEGEETTPFPTHIADIADVESRLNRDSYLITQLTWKLKDIDAALRKIVEKTYGICEDCDNGIRRERLEAIPYAKYCKSCADKREKVGWREEEL